MVGTIAVVASVGGAEIRAAAIDDIIYFQCSASCSLTGIVLHRKLCTVMAGMV